MSLSQDVTELSDIEELDWTQLLDAYDYARPQRGELVDAVGGVLDGAQAGRGVLGERPSRLGRDDPPAHAQEQIGAQGLLELADLLGHRGLGHVQGLGGRGERAELECGAEAAELLQRQKLSFGLRQGTEPTCGSGARK